MEIRGDFIQYYKKQKFKRQAINTLKIIMSIIGILGIILVLIVAMESIYNKFKYKTNDKIESVVTNVYITPTTTPVVTILPQRIETSRGGIDRGVEQRIPAKPVEVVDKVEKKVEKKVESNENKATKDKVDFKYIDSFMGNITAYTSDYEDCEKYPWDKYYGIGSSGIRVTANHTVAMARNIPYGTKIRVDGFSSIFTKEDTGGAIKNGCVDIFTNDRNFAKKWGRQKRMVYILSYGDSKIK